jgi:NADPH:quinone reductase
MRAAWYEKQGAAREVLQVGEMPDPQPGPGEVRIRIAASGINPGDVKKRRNEYGYGMPYPRVIPHSDGAGYIDRVGQGASAALIGQAAWCYGAQSYRPFGTAAEFTVVPVAQAVLLPGGVPLEQGALLGIPGITAHRAVHVSGAVEGRTLLVQGGAGAVGTCAVHLARRAGATVIATVRSSSEESDVRAAGAHHVAPRGEHLLERVRALAPDGIHHIIEGAFATNLLTDVELLAPGGSIATYAADDVTAEVPFWALVFKNVRVYFLGSDDFPSAAKTAAAQALNEALAAGWKGQPIAARLALCDIALAHERVERPDRRGRVLLAL